MSDLEVNRGTEGSWAQLEAAAKQTDAERLADVRMIVGELIDFIDVSMGEIPPERTIVTVREHKDKFLDVRGRLSFVFGHETPTGY